MGDLYGSSIDIDDPFFGELTDDDAILRQRAKIALGTPPGALDGFPEHGFVFDEQVLSALDSTSLALLPLEVRTGLEQEPAIVSAEVSIERMTTKPDGGVDLALGIQVTGAEGEATGFSLPVSS